MNNVRCWKSNRKNGERWTDDVGCVGVQKASRESSPARDSFLSAYPGLDVSHDVHIQLIHASSLHGLFVIDK